MATMAMADYIPVNSPGIVRSIHTASSKENVGSHVSVKSPSRFNSKDERGFSSLLKATHDVA